MEPLTDLIFKIRHKVTIPTIASISENTIKSYGMPTTGISNMDTNMYNAPLVVYATVNEQVSYWEKGHYVRISTATIANRIYNDIQKYLKSWAGKLQDGGSMNRMNHPVDDLKTLDRYAQSMHELLGIRGKVEHQESSLIRLLNPAAEVADQVMATADKESYVRDGMSDFFDSSFVDKQRI